MLHQRFRVSRNLFFLFSNHFSNPILHRIFFLPSRLKIQTANVNFLYHQIPIQHLKLVHFEIFKKDNYTSIKDWKNWSNNNPFFLLIEKWGPLLRIFFQNFSKFINQGTSSMCSDGCRNFLTDATRLFHPGRANRKRGEVIIVNNYCAAIIFCLWHGGWIGNVDTLCWSEPLKWNSGAPLECTMLEDIKGVVLLNLMDVGRSLLSYFFREISFSTMIHLGNTFNIFIPSLDEFVPKKLNKSYHEYL